MELKEDYIIVNKYVVNLNFNVYTSPTKFVGEGNPLANQSHDLGFAVTFQEDTGLFYVDLILKSDISIMEEKLYTIDITYRGIVVINNKLDDDAVKECLYVSVPSALYKSLQFLVEDVTNHSGYAPILLDEYTFKKEFNNVIGKNMRDLN